jgi:HAD superfamily hydrolase (TIGR01490 family)
MENKRIIVAFDFDGTITSRDTFLEFIKFTKGKKLFYVGFLLYSPLLVAYKMKLYPNWKVKEKIFGYFFKGISISEFSRLGESFMERITKIVRPKALETIKGYQQQKVAIYVISASIYNWVAPWCRSVGIESVLGTEIETDNQGLLTGRFLTKNCYGEEKVNRLIEKEPDRKTYLLYAYGDSRGDKELIEFADKGWYNKFK